jgi:hypothetical protein
LRVPPTIDIDKQFIALLATDVKAFFVGDASGSAPPDVIPPS